MIYHEVHGDSIHDLSIFLVERYAEKKNYKFLNKKALQDKSIYPGIPDVLFRKEDKIIRSKGKKVNLWMDYIIEIESNPTKQSTELKTNQFQTDGICDLLIIPLNQYPRMQEFAKEFFAFEDWLRGRLP